MATVLIADDDESVTTLVRAGLEKRGYRVFTCRNGSEAITTFLTVRPHMLLLDVRMPVIDGARVCRSVRSVETGLQVPIVLVSSLDRDTLDDITNEAGASEMMQKPFSLRQLYAVVERHLPLDPPKPALQFTQASATSSPGGT